jgi:hypothetical protein
LRRLEKDGCWQMETWAEIRVERRVRSVRRVVVKRVMVQLGY